MTDASYEPSSWASSTRHRWLEVVFLVGLAGVFFANAVVALVEPVDFTDLVEKSVLGWTVDIAGAFWITPVIFVNDMAIGLAVLATIWAPRVVRNVVLAWAGAWFLVIALVKVSAL